MGSKCPKIEKCKKAECEICKECKKGYCFYGECNDVGCSQCRKCDENCLYYDRNKCNRCKCGYGINQADNFECYKINGEFNGILSEYGGDYKNCNAEHFIRVNIILLLLIISLILKLH